MTFSLFFHVLLWIPWLIKSLTSPYLEDEIGNAGAAEVLAGEGEFLQEGFHIIPGHHDVG